MEWFISCMTTNYFNFQGRARRKEYWMFILFFYIIFIGIGLIAGFMGVEKSSTALKALQLILLLIFFIPTLAVQVRRLHDTSRSGWWILLNLIPLIGPLVIFIFNLLDSTPGDNEYGPNPKN